MELNPGHLIIARLYNRYNANGEDPVVRDSVELLFELALIAEGSGIADSVRLNRLAWVFCRKPYSGFDIKTPFLHTIRVTQV